MTVTEPDNPLGPVGNVRTMGGKDQCCSVLPVEFGKEIDDRIAVFRVQITGGLVGKEDFWTVD